ncbi:MAG: RloB domain-containing protein [Acholeplasmataceae bacterium]|jgi:hypothetical protein|nr:RloB domain-containing protein [Acholeplasmataceae bacterium]
MNKLMTPKGRKGRKTTPLPYGRHLVYSEGEKTEPFYIENLKKVIKQNQKDKWSKIIIEVNPESSGKDPLKLVEFAEKDVEKKRKTIDKIDHVWIFYDKDDFSKDNFDNAYTKIIGKNKNEYKNYDEEYTDENGTRWHACWSNECFELWVLLHFCFTDSALSRKQYIPKINEYLNPKGLSYSKNLPKLYDILSEHGNINEAVRRAKRLDERLENPNVKENPSTGVYIFLERFNQFL